MLLMILGLFIKIKPIKAQSQYEDYIKLSYITFKQSAWHIWYNPYELVLDKNYDYHDSRYGYGHIKKIIDFKRSFYFKLMDNYIPYYKETCQINYGIAVVFGEHQSSSYRLSKRNDQFLVNGLDKSVVVIFRFKEKLVDILDCRISECKTNKAPLKRERFDELSNEINLNVNILYNAQNKLLQIFKYDKNYKTELLIEQKIDLAEYLLYTNGFGYIGITSTDYKCYYAYDLFGSEISYNGLIKITPNVKLIYNKETYNPNDNITIPPNQEFSLIVEYETENDREMMGTGYLTRNGEVFYVYPEKSKNKYTFRMKTLNNYGKVVLSYHNDYDRFDFFINIQSREASRLIYAYGKDPKEGQCYEEIGDNIILLKYGTLKHTGNCGGDFDLSEFGNDPYLYFYVKGEDEFGNPCEIQDIQSMEDKLVKESKMTLKLEKADVPYTYKLGVKVNNKGIYTLYSTTLNYDIRFIVKNLVPSKTYSKCHIDNFSQKAYNSGVNLDYICEFRDEDNEKINVKDSKEEKGVTFSSLVYRLVSDKISDTTFKPEEKCDSNICTYTYMTDYNGKYLFETQFGIDKKTVVNSDGQNTFYVSPEPTTLDGSRFFKFPILWNEGVNIDELDKYFFTYDEESSYRDNLFLIDLVDTKDPNKAYYSEIEQAYEYINLDNIIGNIVENHSSFNKSLNFIIYTDISNNKKYILVQLEESRDKMRRSSLTYFASLKFGREANVKIKYQLDHIGPYHACGKDLNESASFIKQLVDDSVKAGVEAKVAQLILKTDEEHLYNYFLTDRNQIQLSVENSKCVEDKTCKIDFSNSEIYGVYDLLFYSEKKGEYKISAKLKGKELNNFTVKVDSYDQAYELEKINSDISGTAGKEVKLGFKIKDRYGNYLNYPLNNDYFGLSLSITLDNIDRSSDFFKFEKGEEENVYYIKENDIKSGNYKVKLKTRYSNSSIVFEYHKTPGSADPRLSSANILNKDQISIGEISSAEVNLYDEYGNIIDPESEQYESELTNVEVYATNNKGNRIDYSRSERNVFKTGNINKSGTFELTVTISGKGISHYGIWKFDVIDNGYDFSLSQLKMIGEKVILMTEKGYYTLYNGLQRPSFEFDFINIEGLPSVNVDTTTEIEAKFYSDGSDPISLEKLWISNNKLLWILPDNFSLENKKKYTFEIIKGETSRKYYLLIANYGEDKSSGKSISISETLVSPNVLYLKAGISDSFTIELKGEDYLRYDALLDLNDLKFENNNCTSVKPIAKLGNKNGQYIVDVLSNTALDFSDNCQISMEYKNEKIPTNLTVIVSPGELNHFTFNESSLIPTVAGSDLKIKLYPKDKYGNQIKDSLFDNKEFSEGTFSYLFNAKHSSGYKVSLTTTTNPVSHYIELTLISEKAGNITLSSIYLEKEYNIKLVAGKASKYSTGYLIGEKGPITAGTKRTYVIEPRDKNGNKLTDKKAIEEIFNDYSVNVYDENGKEIPEFVEDKFDEKEGKIEFVFNNEISGTRVIKAYYDNEEIINVNNVIHVVNGSPEINKTKLIYNNKVYSLEDKLKLSLASLPIIDVQLYDAYDNKVSELKNLEKMDFQLNVTNEQLLDFTFYNNYIRLYINEKKIDKYFEIKKSEKSELVLEINSDEKKYIEVVFEDESPVKDEDEPKYFTLNTNNLVLKTGEEGLLSLTFYTDKGKPMGHFFNSTLDISVSCSDDKKVNTEVYNGKYYGTYNILVSSPEASNGQISCSINVKEMKNNFSLRVLPGTIKYCELVKDPLPEIKAGETYELKLECFDKFPNKGYLNDELFGGILINPKGEIVELKSNSNSDNSFSLYVEPTFEGEYTIKSEYLLKDIVLKALPGKISGENSYVNMKKNANAGGKLDVDIVVLDKYNNFVNLVEGNETLFNLYYRYRENNKYNDYKKVDSKGELVENEEGKTVIRYSQTVSKDGVNEFRVIYLNTLTALKCSNCEVNVAAGEFNLKESEVYKFNSFSMTYTKLDKNNDVLYNEEENLFIRIYPKDSYGNKVSPKGLQDISVTISGTALKKLDPSDSDEYIEFQENNGEFSKLENGEYNLVIEYGGNKETYSVRVSGKDGFTDEVDFSKTKLIDSNLDFTAGKYGYFNFELRDKNNVRSTSTEKRIVSVDNGFQIKVFNSQSSTILVLVTSEEANVFPNEGKTKLNVFIGEEKVLSDLELIINPDDLYKAEINSTYLEPESKELKSVTTDEDLRFSLIGTDSYGNKVLLGANEAKLKVKSQTNDFSYKSSFVDLLTGEQIYLYQITAVGEYNITAGNNSKDKQLFVDVYSLSVKSGEVCPEKTIVLHMSNELEAGKSGIVLIYPRDKNNNNVELNDKVLSKFSAYLLSSDYEIIRATQIYTSYLSYEVELNNTGNYVWNVQYNNRKIKFDKNSISVNPSTCYPDNTLIYFKDKNGEYVELNKENKDSRAYSSYTSPLSLHLIFRDRFSNVINEDQEIKVKDAYLSGNYMENLYWTYKYGYLELEDKSKIENLVSNTGNKAYSFRYTIIVGEEVKTYELKVNHFGVKDEDEEYGNGNYDLEQSVVEPKIAKFRVGTYYEILLTLKTKQNLTYYGDFPTKNIDCNNLKPDKDSTFKCNVYQKDKGKYILRYYTELPKKENENIYNIIKLTDPKYEQNDKNIEVLLVNSYGIPSKKYTEVKTHIKETVKTDQNELVLEFKLQDEFKNVFETEEIIGDLLIENNGVTADYSITYSGEQTYRATIKPQYPPREINIQLYYKDSNTKVELLPEVEKSTFEFNLDYSNTIVNSKNINRMKAGEFLDLNIILYDQQMNCYVSDDYSPSLLSVTVQGPLEKKAELRTYQFYRYEDSKSECKYIYKIKMDEENRYVETGSYSIVVYAVDQTYTLATYTQTVISGDVDINNFKVHYTDMNEKSYNDQNIPAGEEFHFIVQGYDEFMNKIDTVQLPDLEVNINNYEDNNTVLNCYSGTIGYMACSFSAKKIGNYKFKYAYNKTTILPTFEYGPDVVTYVSGACSAEFNQTIYPNEDEIDISSPYNIMINCLDKYQNQVKKGGAKFTSEISLFIETTQTSVDIDYKVKDNDDGTYQISFVPPLEGEYSIYTYLDGNIYDEKKINITGKSCKEGQYLCPNIHQCVNDLRDCIPDNYQCHNKAEREEKPFFCNDKCVKSMTECEVPGAKKCEYMNEAYPEDREDDLCPYSLLIDCKRKYPSYPNYCPDGICRTSESLKPNQRVCPIGKVLCLDLTCADSIDKCYNEWPECSPIQIRCPDQSCVDDQKNCPTTITCANESDVVCPDGTCVKNEIYCAKLKNCPEETPYLCSDNSCATKPESCPHSSACGHGKSLCSDLICRESC